MALQICPQCKQKKMFWWIDEEITPLTQWRCTACQFYALEDETDPTTCPILKENKLE